MKCDISTPINTEEPATLYNLAYNDGEIQEYPNDPLLLYPPATHAALTPERPPCKGSGGPRSHNGTLTPQKERGILNLARGGAA